MRACFRHAAAEGAAVAAKLQQLAEKSESGDWLRGPKEMILSTCIHLRAPSVEEGMSCCPKHAKMSALCCAELIRRMCVN